MSHPQKLIYLDNAATMPTNPEVVRVMESYFTEQFFNPSSYYACASNVRQVVDSARATVSRALGCASGEVRFTSGGTESDNTAVKGIALARRAEGKHVVVSAVEHHAVLESAHWLEHQGFNVSCVPVDSEGRVSAEALRSVMRDDTVLVSIMHANNEVGTLQPIAQLTKVAHETGALFHCDAVQSFGHIPVDVQSLGVDALSLSAHKIGGPKGVGALYVRRGVSIEPLLHGGAQERGNRAGTENVPGIIGLACAVRLIFGSETPTPVSSAIERRAQHVAAVRDHLIDRVLSEIPDTLLNGSRNGRLPGNASFCFSGASSEPLLMLLDQEGICASAGSACASGSLDPSHVLVAMGRTKEEAAGALRLTLSSSTKKEDVDRAVDVLVRSVAHLRSIG